MSRVLLGLCDQKIPCTAETSWDVNKIGGRPDWMRSGSREPECRVCGSGQLFIGQFYCPLSRSNYHRTLYVFACPNQTCSSQPDSCGWTVLRSQLESTAPSSSADSVGIGSGQLDEWGSGADEWDSEGSTDGLDICSSLTSSCRLEASSAEGQTAETGESGCAAVWPVTGANSESDVDGNGGVDTDVRNSTPETGDGSGVLESYYMSVIDEPEDVISLDYERRLLTEYAHQEGISVKDLCDAHGSETSGGSREKYEKCRAKHGDQMFYKFTQIIGRCPEQIVRYSYGGQPLHALQTTAQRVHVPPCCCGSERIFEFQLMPALVQLLRSSRSTDPVVEFMSVLVYSCRQCCWTDADDVLEEFVVVEDDLERIAVETALNKLKTRNCKDEQTDVK